MNKRRDKEYFTIDPELREEFLKHINKNNLNKSKLIENLIKKYLDNFKIDKDS